jgi:hypothetical protein
VRWRWFEGQLEAVFYTFYEMFRGMGLRRSAPIVAAIAFVMLGGATLLIALDVFALAAGRVSTWPISQAPRSIAGIAVLGGYFVWDRFACPERIALLESLHASEAEAQRYRRRLKVAAFVAVLIAICFATTEA